MGVAMATLGAVLPPRPWGDCAGRDAAPRIAGCAVVGAGVLGAAGGNLPQFHQGQGSRRLRWRRSGWPTWWCRGHSRCQRQIPSALTEAFHRLLCLLAVRRIQPPRRFSSGKWCRRPRADAGVDRGIWKRTRFPQGGAGSPPRQGGVRQPEDRDIAFQSFRRVSMTASGFALLALDDSVYRRPEQALYRDGCRGAHRSPQDAGSAMTPSSRPW